MQQALADEVNRSATDLVIASQFSMMPYALSVREVPLVLEELELESFRPDCSATSPISRVRQVLTWLKMSYYLRRALPRFAACTLASERELTIARTILPEYREFHVLPNAVDPSDYELSANPQEHTLIYPGALTFDANYDAVLYFAQSILPLIRRAIPGVLVLVTGSTAGVNLKPFQHHQGIVFTGHLPDVRQAIAGSWGTIVPLREGGGTRLKIIESMALGTPVVATSKGAEGLDVLPDRDILIADSPGDFADACVRLFRSRALRDQLADGGRMLVCTRYNWDIQGARLRDIVSRAVSNGGSLLRNMRQ